MTIHYMTTYDNSTVSLVRRAGWKVVRDDLRPCMTFGRTLFYFATFDFCAFIILRVVSLTNKN